MMSLIAFKKHLALPKTSWQICLLAAIGGIASAFLIILFTLSIDLLQQLYLNQKEDYTSLDFVSRFDLPIIGSILIILFAWLTGYQYLRTGIPFVLHRLKVAHGVIPLRNTLNQFVGTVIALASGFSVGREGPAVHLGAAISSYIGSAIKLPFNAIRTLCACGIAAGIAASFNTPVAAVIFVMEVILREYKVHIFIPVMIAAIIGSLITSHIFGPAHKYEFFSKIAIEVNLDYPLLIVTGLILGILAFAFNRYLTLIIKHSSNYHIVPRFLLAAFITGAIGSVIPYAMGTDTSAINFFISDNAGFQLILGLLIAKFVMTVTALGLGIPGGIVGPILGIGAIAGASVAAISNDTLLSEHLLTDYALMGMAGFMAATLNAPLAALLAVVELSNQIEVIIPAMIVITTACVFSGQFFNNRSVFVMQLEVQNLIYRQSPIQKSLQRIGAIGIMKENFKLIPSSNKQSYISQLSEAQEQLLIVKEENSDMPYSLIETMPLSADNNGSLIEKHPLIPLSDQVTLADAYQALVDKRRGGVYLYKDNKENIIGVVLFSQLRKYLLHGKTR